MRLTTSINTVIVNFLWEKKGLIEKFTMKDNYITDTDLDEVHNWPLHYKIKFIQNMVYLKQYTYDRIKDNNFCPWCTITNDECSTCTYGARHKKCVSDNGSDYVDVVDLIQRKHKALYGNTAISKEYSIPCSIKSVPGMKELILKYSNLCKEILDQIENIKVFNPLD